MLGDVPGVVDEELTLGLVGRDGQLDLRVRVLESRPQVMNGVVRHRLRPLLMGARRDVLRRREQYEMDAVRVFLTTHRGRAGTRADCATARNQSRRLSSRELTSRGGRQRLARS